MSVLDQKNSRRTFAAAALLGTVYAVGMRLLFAGEIQGFELLTRSFFIGVPIVTGALTAWLSLNNGQSIWDAIAATTLAILVFVVTCMLVGLEGLICIVLLLPILVILPFSGVALVYLGWKFFKRFNRATLPALALLPLLTAPIEQYFPIDVEPFTITDRLLIRAPPAQVWSELTNVQIIRRDELQPAVIFAMGVPRPLEAHMDGKGLGASRTSRWEKNVVFQERMTRWLPGREMAYDFVIDPQTIPAAAFDEHVRIGGKNYQLLSGGYRLVEVSPGVTELTLSTTIANHSRTGLYGKAWSNFVFDEFHGVILDLIRDRSEARTNASEH